MRMALRLLASLLPFAMALGFAEDFAPSSAVPDALRTNVLCGMSVVALEAGVRLHQRYSNRVNRNKARIKFLVKRFGEAKFRALFQEEFERLRALRVETDIKLAVGEFTIDAVGGDDGIIDEHAERDDQRGDGNLLQRHAERRHAAERHRNRQRNGHGDDERRAPVHEQQGDEHDNNHRLNETA